MKFKILSGNATYIALEALKQKCIAANKASLALATEFGGDKCMMASHLQIMAGGLSGIHFLVKPANWKIAWDKKNDVFIPSKKNKEALAKIDALPLIWAEELNKIVGFKEQDIKNDTGRGFIWVTRPNLQWSNPQFFLLSMHEEAKYTPKNSHIIEITTSEYKSLFIASNSVIQ
jgi:hypothetical protein